MDVSTKNKTDGPKLGPLAFKFCGITFDVGRVWTHRTARIELGIVLLAILITVAALYFR